MDKKQIAINRYKGKSISDITKIVMNVDGIKLNEYDGLMKKAVMVDLNKIDIIKLKEIESFLLNITTDNKAIGCEQILKKIQKQIQSLGF